MQRSRGPTAETTMIRRWSATLATLDVPFAIKQPAAWLHDKAGAAGEAADDDQYQTRQIAGEPGRKSIVDAVGEHGPEPDME
jgi:hypothetical protein